MVVFAPKAPKTHITVFTDTDCGYCQKLHSEVPELNRLGVEVRYVAFPRQGLNSPAAKELVSVWCAKDQQDAMNRAKTRQSVADASCDNPVAKQYQLGQMIGVNGTPAIVLANGKMIPGYQPAPQLAKIALESND
jgi:thiol:disulfide interchange protein DsbC